ncbi:protein-tyrosine phosphatase-like protein [Pavlovales sp. CCMP2436]|nr:protein-tyrosine phosphatase-like protein [Pavlovales sp. CCMP2436]
MGWGRAFCLVAALLLATRVAYAQGKPKLERGAKPKPPPMALSAISMMPTPRLPPPLGHAAIALGAISSLCCVLGWMVLPTALWVEDGWRTVALFCKLQLPLLGCGMLMGLMLKSQRRGGAHTSPRVLWLVSRLNLVPTPLIYCICDLLGVRGYYQRVPMPEEAPNSPSAPGADAPLYLGGLPLPWHVVALRALGVRAVVNMCDEFDGWTDLYETLGIEQLRLPTTDYMDVSAVNLRKAVAFIDSNRARGQGVYVHCKAGVGRAGSVAVTYLASRAERELRLDAPVQVGRAQVRAAVEWAERSSGGAPP